MKNKYLILGVIVLILVVGIGGYFLTKEKTSETHEIVVEEENISTPALTLDSVLNGGGFVNGERYPTNKKLPVETIDRNFVVFGDIDGDGKNEAVASVLWCGASCGTEVFVFKYTNSGVISQLLSESIPVPSKDKIKSIEIKGGFIIITRVSRDTEIDYVTKYDGKKIFYNLTLISPNGGETLKIGQKYEIRWEAVGVENVSISLGSGGKNFGDSDAIPASSGRYTWTVPDMSSWFESGVSPNNFKIHISSYGNEGLSDVSDGTFTIIK